MVALIIPYKTLIRKEWPEKADVVAASGFGSTQWPLDMSESVVLSRVEQAGCIGKSMIGVAVVVVVVDSFGRRGVSSLGGITSLNDGRFNGGRYRISSRDSK